MDSGSCAKLHKMLVFLEGQVEGLIVRKLGFWCVSNRLDEICNKTRFIILTLIGKPKSVLKLAVFLGETRYNFGFLSDYHKFCKKKWTQ